MNQSYSIDLSCEKTAKNGRGAIIKPEVNNLIIHIKIKHIKYKSIYLRHYNKSFKYLATISVALLFLYLFDLLLMVYVCLNLLTLLRMLFAKHSENTAERI